MKKNMTRFLLALLLLMLVGCNQPEPVDEVELRFLSPMGAPAISLVEVVKQGKHEVSFVSGTDNLTAAFVNPNPQYDVILAPINLGVSLISKGSTTYRLWGVATWGNLYIIAENDEALLEEGNLALFGESAVPQRIFDTVSPSFELSLSPVYAASVNDAVAQLITGNAKAAMVAQPLLTATLANHSQFTVVIDLQEQWKQVTGKENYPQAAIFVEVSQYQEHKLQIDQQLLGMQTYLSQALVDSSALKSDLEQIDPMTLGLPPAQVTIAALKGMNVNISKATDVRDEISEFLKLFNLTSLSDYLLQ